VIEKILETKRREVQALGEAVFPPRKGPVRRLVFDGAVNIIAELKRRSPSAGTIGEIDEARIATYDRYAKAISVLTDASYFGGSYEFLAEVADATTVPILCKDFIIDPAQIDRAFAAGADLVLLIARILTRKDLESLRAHAHTLGLACLVELHDRADMEKIEGMHPDMIGINGRDLDTLTMDLSRVAELLPEVRAPFRIAESGIKSRQDIERMKRAGANGFLIGETLMRAPHPEAVFEELLDG
jgi:indole-3-glycerol phosphate synthase